MVHLGEKNKWEKADFIDRKMLRNRVEHLDSRNLSSQYEKDIRSFNILSELANFILLLWWSYPHEDYLQYEKHLDALTEASEDQVMTQITQLVSPAIFGIESQTDSVILIYVHFQQYNHKPVPQIKNNKIKQNLFAFKWKLEKYLWKVQQINYEMNQELQFNHKTCDMKEIVVTKK